MRSPVLFVFILSAALLLFIAHYAAYEFYLYWKYDWFDIPVHILGGTIIGLSVFLLPLFRVPVPSFCYGVPGMLVLVLIVGILWEFFEWYNGISTLKEGFVLDTVIDLSMNIIGGLIGYSVGKNVKEW